jgi:hypothetical protein
LKALDIAGDKLAALRVYVIADREQNAKHWYRTPIVHYGYLFAGPVLGTNSRSHRLAEILRDRIPDILQTAEPFVSDVDVGAGAPWMNQLTKALEEKRFGILCITPENQENPWIHFEPGARFLKSRSLPLPQKRRGTLEK